MHHKMVDGATTPTLGRPTSSSNNNNNRAEAVPLTHGVRVWQFQQLTSIGVVHQGTKSNKLLQPGKLLQRTTTGISRRPTTTTHLLHPTRVEIGVVPMLAAEEGMLQILVDTMRIGLREPIQQVVVEELKLTQKVGGRHKVRYLAYEYLFNIARRKAIKDGGVWRYSDGHAVTQQVLPKRNSCAYHPFCCYCELEKTCGNSSAGRLYPGASVF